MPSKFLATTVVAAFAIVSANAEAQTPKRGGTLVYSVSLGEPETFDCHATSTVATLYRLAPHYSMLIRLDPANYPQVTKDLADSWEMAPDGLTYTFHLHPNVQFHDGTILTAADVKASIDRLRDPKPGVISVRQAQYRDISAIEAPDDRTVIIRLSKPNAAMLSLLASPWNCIYSAKKMASDPNYPARVVMGTGPFRFTNYVAGSQWEGQRFENYFREGRPYLDGFKAVSTSPTGFVTATIGGQVMTDFRGYSAPDRDRIVAARGDAMRVAEVESTMTFFSYSFNTQHKPLDDVRVRRALALAIDHKTGQQLMAKLLTISAAGGFLRPGSQFAQPWSELQKQIGFRPDLAASRAEAKRLLAEAGVKDLKLTFVNRAQYPMIGVFLIDQWRQIGVTVTQELPENARFFAARDAGNYDIIPEGGADYLDEPSLQLAAALSYDLNPQNGSRAIDRKVDELFEKQARELDPAKRKAITTELENYLIDQAYRIPLFWGKPSIVMDKRIVGYPDAPSPYIGLDWADIWLN